MVKKNRTGPLKERYIDETITFIDEKGDSAKVNLRAISKRIGCAHTNAYNYFNSLEDLLWAALEKTLTLYSQYISKGLTPSLSGFNYFDHLIGNMIQFSTDHTGLYRFVSTDALNMSNLPDTVLQQVMTLKTYFTQVIFALGAGKLTEKKARRAADIILAYLDGEILAMINKRVLPGEDIKANALENVHTLFTLLTSNRSDGIDLKDDREKKRTISYPTIP